MALEDRLRLQAKELGIPVDRLRRRVMFERTIARLDTANWLVGAEGRHGTGVRLQDNARLTIDIDLGLRDDVEKRRRVKSVSDRCAAN